MIATISHIDQYKDVTTRLNQNDPLWLKTLRLQALNDFEKKGFPTHKNEDWKYINLQPLLNKTFAFIPKEKTKVNPGILPDFSGNRVVFINGNLETKFSHLNVENISIKPLRAALKDDVVKQHLHQLTKEIHHGFAKLNTALTSDGYVIEISKNETVIEPIHIIHVTTEALQTHTHNLIIAHENSHAVVIEHFIDIHSLESHYFMNTMTEAFVKENADLTYYKIINDKPAFHIGTTIVEQLRDSRFKSYALTLNGRLIRSDICIKQAAENAYCELKGLYITADRQHVDHYTNIDHLKPHGISRENYKGILADYSRAVFNGKIHVHPGAIQTNADQSNKNLLLSTHAEIDTKPQLEIYNDDVKCTHGAAIGCIDESALFYLRSRGINKDSAERLLVQSFAREIIDDIKINAVKDYLTHIIEEKLK